VCSQLRLNRTNVLETCAELLEAHGKKRYDLSCVQAIASADDLVSSALFTAETSSHFLACGSRLLQFGLCYTQLYHR
jgi:hypothetical protein